MGKWATYQKRGTHHGTTLSPPPAPTLEIDGEDHVIQRAQHGPPNPDGSITLWESLDGITDWYGVAVHAFEAVHDWGEAATWPGVFLSAFELGGNVTYAGTSPRSNVLATP
jgi:hypothetical protein